MELAAEGLASLCSGMFFGAAFYISVVQHPASIAAGRAVPGMFFPHMYRRAAPMQASLAILGAVAGVGAWLMQDEMIWLIGAIALASVVPITLFYIKPVNDILLRPGIDPESSEVAENLRRWGFRHWWRTAASGISFALFIVGVLL